MPFETLKRSHLKRNILIGVVIVAIIAAIVINFTRAKYRVAQALPLINGTVNYSPGDIIITAYYNNEQLDTFPTKDSGYSVESITCDNGATATFDSSNWEVTVTNFVTKGTKCDVYFAEDTTKPTISNVASSVTKTSITLTVSATDDTGVTGYYYRLGTSGSYTNSSSNSHTFSGLTAGTSYTINVYVVDAAGNESSVYSTSISTQADGQSISTILAGKTISTRSSFSSTLTTNTTGTVYSATDDDGTTYYFAGNPTDNWVSFAGFYWRIIRVNGDGSIRLIYQGTSANTTGTGTQISTSAFNSSYNNNMYVGYMYTSGSVHGLGTSSTIKGVLDTWYSNNLSSYASYIDTNAGFCNDRTPSGGNGTTYLEYGPYNRLYNTRTPTFGCSDKSNDLFTVSSSNKGNKALTNPIGLITTDEVWYAGGYQADNSSYYLYTSQKYWTMSPCYFSFDNAGAFYVTSTGSLLSDNVPYAFGVRPVINLKADTLFETGGAGTSTNPYVVEGAE